MFLSALAARADNILTGVGSGAVSQINVIAPGRHEQLGAFLAYDAAFTGGVRVAAGDVNGDGVADIITGAGPGGGSHVKVFDGVTRNTLHSFFAFPGFNGGVFVATGDVNGDRINDVIVAAGSNAPPQVVAFNGTNVTQQLRSFFAYDPGFTGGVRVAAGDVNGDGVADIITGAGNGGGTHVKVFSGESGGTLHSFFAFPGFLGGVTVASGDVNGDGFADIITGADAGLGGHVKVFNGNSGAEIRSFFTYGTGFTGGVNVAAGDYNLDGRADVLVSPSAGFAQMVRVFSGADHVLLDSFFAFQPGFTGGVSLGMSTPPPVGGTVSGNCFLDSDGNGRRDTEEPPVMAHTVFVDGNANRVHDPGEQFQMTDAKGNFVFQNLIPGNYFFNQAPLAGHYPTSPDSVLLNVVSGNTITNVEFGNLPLPRLSIRRDGTNAVLAWPDPAERFELHAADKLNQNPDWKPVTNLPVRVNGSLVVTQAVRELERFFILRLEEFLIRR